ncbi:hypothetical protein F1645_02725 [Novacetimonas hansenii]
MKLFPKSFRRRRLFGKRRHPKIFLVFYQRVAFKQSLRKAFQNVAILEMAPPDSLLQTRSIRSHSIRAIIRYP